MIESPLPDDYLNALTREAARLGPFAAEWHFYESLTSTNDVAALMTPSTDAGAVVIAHAQTAGRGRGGRQWFSAPGAGLYASVLLPRQSVADVAVVARLTLMVAVALVESIDASTGVSANIKWPNDLLVGRRKLAGILVEARTAAVPEQVVIGFGINLRRRDYPEEIRERVTSIEAEGGRAARAEVLVEALAAIAAGLADLEAGRFDAILSRWRRRSPSSVGADIEWAAPAGPRRGTTAGIDDTGALMIRKGTAVERIFSGDVRWL